jgi:SAM-dependent methyltransferase
MCGDSQGLSIEAEHVLDLAAGTGKLTRVLVERFPRVTAVEPLVGMRTLGEQLVPEATWLGGSAETIPLADASVDAAFVAEAFHWFDSWRSSAELARILRPGAPLVVLFTDWDGCYTPGMPVEAREVFGIVAKRTGPAGAAKLKTGAWQQGLTTGSFAPLEKRRDPVYARHRSRRDDRLLRVGQQCRRSTSRGTRSATTAARRPGSGV